MWKRCAIVVLVLAVLIPLIPHTARADGIIIPIRPEPLPLPPLQSLAIRYHHVQVSIEDRVATTHIDQVFRNDLPYEVEGEYIFPIPEGASIGEFAMWVDGVKLEAQALDAEEARAIYEEIVRSRRDPALLEYAGRGAFRARIYPIPPNGERRIEISYTEVLPLEAGLVRYVYPLSTEKHSAQPLEEASVSVTIRSKEPIQDVYAPRHRIDVEREGPGLLRVGWEAQDVTPDQDFTLYYTLSGAPITANLLSYKSAGEDGYWLLLLTPADDPSVEVAPKDVFLVLDTSGSMSGAKIEQAREAALYVLDYLNPEDRFNIVSFATAIRLYAKGLVPAGDAGAAAFVKGLQAQGGTNISRALAETLSQTERGRQQIVLFLTDGLPTEGEIRIDQIVQQVAKTASDNVRFYCFGVGYDVNTHLLDTLAQEHSGVSVYVQPGEDIAYAVRSLYDRIRSPVLSSPAIDWSGVMADDMYPYPLPDLYAGSQVVLVGRYRQGGSASLTLTGDGPEGTVSHRFDDLYLVREGGADFVPQLWATRKVGYLLTQVRLHGANAELIDEIIALSVRYGIVTPYTSFLIDDTEDALTYEGRASIADQELALATPAPQVASGVGASGEAAVAKSVAQEALRTSDRVDNQPVELVRQVGDRAFVLREGIWTDTRYELGDTLEAVAFGSERYLQLARQHSTWGACLALGEQVILVEDGVAYHMGAPDGATEAVEEPSTPVGDGGSDAATVWDALLAALAHWMSVRP
jgi:Ca-activated chloride channel family protein